MKKRKNLTAKKRLWILNADLLTQDQNRRFLPKSSFLIEDDTIVEIVKGQPKAKWIKDRSVKANNLEGQVIIPGFVQAHIHLCQTLFRHMADDLELLDWLKERIWKFEAAHSADTLEISALLGIQELLSSGTTCILDMATVRHTETIFKAVLKTGIRANVGKCLMDDASSNPENLCESTQDAMAEAKALFQKWNGMDHDRIRASFAPRFAVSCTEDLLNKVATEAGMRNALIHTHASENQKEVQLVKERTQLENIDYLRKVGILGSKTVIAYGIWLSENEKLLLKQTNTKIAHCPSSNLKLASGIADIVDLRRHGITVAIGADGAPCNNRLDAFQEMRLAALLQKVKHGPTAMPAQEAFDLATRDGAIALNWFDQIGSLEIGKKADFCSLKLDSYETLPPGVSNGHSRGEALVSALVYSGHPGLVTQTWVAGKPVFSKSKVKGIELPKLLDRAKIAQKKILKRVQEFPGN